jgi:hypothetical protein
LTAYPKCKKQDDCAYDSSAGVMSINPAFLSGAAVTSMEIEPRELSFEHPSIRPELLAGVDAALSRTRPAAEAVAGMKATPMTSFIIRKFLVSLVEPGGCGGNRRKGVGPHLQRGTAVDIGSFRQEDERDVADMHGETAFGAHSIVMRRTRTNALALLLVGLEEVSMQDRLRPKRSACRRRRLRVTLVLRPPCPGRTSGRGIKRIQRGATRILTVARSPFGLAGLGHSGEPDARPGRIVHESGRTRPS